MLRRTLSILVAVWAVWVHSSLPLQAAESPAAMPALEWAMLPGETLQQLAQLIYPQNPVMQQRFVDACVALNRQTLPDLGASTPFDGPTPLLIPDLRALAANAPPDMPPLRLSRETGRLHAARAALNPTPGLEPVLQLSPRLESLRQRNQALETEQTLMAGRLDLLEKQLREMQVILHDARPRKRKLAPMPAKQPETPQPPVWLPVLQSLQEHWLVVAAFVAGLLAVVTGWRLRRRLGRAMKAAMPSPAATPVSPDVQPVQPLPPATGVAVPAAPSASQHHDHGTMHVDEIDSIVEEARVFYALGRQEQALEMLIHHIEAHPRQSVSPWLYLLELYRASGRQQEFTALARRMHKTFNVMAPNWETTAVAMVVPVSLEEFPHILGKVTANWGKTECHDYLNSLIQDNRDGERAGFSLDVLNEILLLLSILEMRDTLG